jgi:hypothetical protein
VAKFKEQLPDGESPVHMLMRIKVGWNVAGHVSERVKLPLQFLSERSNVSEGDDPLARSEMEAEAQGRMFFRQSRCRACAWHVDHKARTRHEPAFVRLDDSSVNSVVRAKVIGIDN